MSQWDQRRKHARLYGQGQWRPVDPSSIIVADVQSPLIRQLLPDNRIAVAAAHLGETSKSVRRVAERLGIHLLSDQVKIQAGRAVDRKTPWAGRLKRIVQTLALLEDRQEIQKLTFHEDLTLRVAGTERPLLAYVEGDILRLSGEPSSFAVEAADQLVNHFRLGQRGHEVAWLTGALFALEDSMSFRTHLKTLADGLGVESDLDDLGTNDHAEPVAESDEFSEPGRVREKGGSGSSGSARRSARFRRAQPRPADRQGAPPH